ncbi:PH domain-containing protein [Corynebacterium hylobatis]|uniref:PH domain-containing protein n=1 Tax=Corynebacterium hylobatis TaxID=1859290 RepID=A0A3S0HJF5_9CORY|nr:PH domain-containing protein [Corynebacterium hylobatis]RSZ66110.1 PH domain-containing protein [Corynebacterium hylobatis]
MSSDAVHAESVQFRPERTHILAAVLMSAIALLVIGSAPQYLFWVLIVPVLFIVWVLRARTTVGEKGVDIRYAFRGSRFIKWENMAGIAFKGSRALLTTKDGKSHPLPAVTFNSLPKLAEASRGRIPDVVGSAEEAAEDKVTIIRRDGEQILISKEEYAARQESSGKKPDNPDTINNSRSN